MFDLINAVVGAIEHEIDEILNWLAIFWAIFTSGFFLYILFTNPFNVSDSPPSCLNSWAPFISSGPIY